MPNKIITLISVGSRRFDAALLAEYSKWAKARSLELVCVMLDGPERHNVKLFDRQEGLNALQIAHSRGMEAAESLAQPGVVIHFWGEIISLVPYEKWRLAVFEEFEKSPHFRHESLNETFKNLQPRFRMLGVLKKTNPLVGLAVNYLLEEIAFKLAARCSGLFRGEILPRKESALVMSIYRGKHLGDLEAPAPYTLVTHDGRHVTETMVGGGVTCVEG